jgi:hypothetical protein
MDELVLNTAGLIHEDRRLFEAHPKVIWKLWPYYTWV